jgi:transposase
VKVMGTAAPIQGEITSAFVETMNAVAYIKFLRRVLWKYRQYNKIHIITDNAKIHHATIVRNFLHYINYKIKIIYLPPFWLELNPMEQIWKYMRRDVTHNTFYATFDDLKLSLRQFFENLKNQNNEVRSRCNFY